MFRIAFALLAILQSVAQPVPNLEVKDSLAHAEALYYGARFSDSIALLTRIDDALKTQQGRTEEKIETKLRLALANIGLNDTAKAKALLVEVYALNTDYAFDTEHFSPKVVAVAAEAKKEQTKILCQSAQDDASKFLSSGNSTAFLELDRSLRTKCPGLSAIEPEAAELFYKAGLAAYRRSEFPDALSNFEAALSLSPEHELALQYFDITRSKLEVSQDRLLLRWQRNFDTHQLTAAAADYRQITSPANTGSAATLNQVTTEYRKALSALVEKWNRTCPSGDVAAMNAIRSQISELLPEPSFGEDIRSQMTECEMNKVAATNLVAGAPGTTSVKTPTGDDPDATTAGQNGCVSMQSQILLTRLKTRVDIQISNELRNFLKNSAQVVVKVKARISESGDVTITGMTDGNPLLNNAVRNAVSEWKFTPVLYPTGPRCVDTEIPIAIKVGQ